MRCSSVMPPMSTFVGRRVGGPDPRIGPRGVCDIRRGTTSGWGKRRRRLSGSPVATGSGDPSGAAAWARSGSAATSGSSATSRSSRSGRCRARRPRTWRARMREARVVPALNHPHVVSIYDVVEEDDHIWLVMEYVASRTLAQVIGRGRSAVARGDSRDRGADRRGTRSDPRRRHHPPRRQTRQDPGQRRRRREDQRLRDRALTTRAADGQRTGHRDTDVLRTRAGARRKPTPAADVGHSAQACMPRSRAIRRTRVSPTPWHCWRRSHPPRRLRRVAPAFSTSRSCGCSIPIRILVGPLAHAAHERTGCQRSPRPARARPRHRRTRSVTSLRSTPAAISDRRG